MKPLKVYEACIQNRSVCDQRLPQGWQAYGNLDKKGSQCEAEYTTSRLLGLEPSVLEENMDKTTLAKDASVVLASVFAILRAEIFASPARWHRYVARL